MLPIRFSLLYVHVKYIFFSFYRTVGFEKNIGYAKKKQAIFQLLISYMYLSQQCRIVFTLQLYLGERVEMLHLNFYFAMSYSH